MSFQTSTDYGVDNRYRAARQATDNTSGKRFLDRFLDSERASNKSTYTQDQQEDNRFVFSAPGQGVNYVFKNAFSSPRSPVQRRTERVAQ